MKTDAHILAAMRDGWTLYLNEHGAILVKYGRRWETRTCTVSRPAVVRLLDAGQLRYHRDEARHWGYCQLVDERSGAERGAVATGVRFPRPAIDTPPAVTG